MPRPKGRGLWPAFWMLPEPFSWPPEIDVFELIGQAPNTIIFSHHWKDQFGKHQMDTKACPGDTDFSVDFHVVSCEWMPLHFLAYRRRRTIPVGANHPEGQNVPALEYGRRGRHVKWPDEHTPFPSSFDSTGFDAMPSHSRAARNGLAERRLAPRLFSRLSSR